MPTVQTITLEIQDDGTVHVHATANGQVTDDEVVKSIDEALQEVQQIASGQDQEDQSDQGDEGQDPAAADQSQGGAALPSAQDMWQQEAAKRKQGA